jgi:hypothetical protein
MQMRKEVFALAITGLFLIATSALALDGSSPVDVSNGDVSLSCSDNNRILGKATGSVSCLNDIPDEVTQKAVVLGTFSGFPALDNYVATYALIAGSDFLSIAKDDPDKVVGVMEYTGTGIVYNLATQGNVTATKQGDNSIAAGDRLKLDTRGAADAAAASTPGTHGSCVAYSFGGMNYYCGKVITAAANERAVGIATSAAATSDTTVDMIVGVGIAPTALSLNDAKQIAYMKSTKGIDGATDKYYPAIGYGNVDQGSLDEKVKTAFPSGAVTDGITCNCEAAMASGKTITIRLCKPNGADDCASGGDDVISSCGIGDSTTTCTDSSFSGTTSLSSNDVLYYYAERPASGGSGCQSVECRFAYTQSEY